MTKRLRNVYMYICVVWCGFGVFWSFAVARRSGPVGGLGWAFGAFLCLLHASWVPPGCLLVPLGSGRAVWAPGGFGAGGPGPLLLFPFGVLHVYSVLGLGFSLSCVCVCVFVRACLRARARACVRACVRACLRVHVCACLRTRVRACLCLCVCVCLLGLGFSFSGVSRAPFLGCSLFGLGFSLPGFLVFPCRRPWVLFARLSCYPSAVLPVWPTRSGSRVGAWAGLLTRQRLARGHGLPRCVCVCVCARVCVCFVLLLRPLLLSSLVVCLRPVSCSFCSLRLSIYIYISDRPWLAQRPEVCRNCVLPAGAKGATALYLNFYILPITRLWRPYVNPPNAQNILCTSLSLSLSPHIYIYIPSYIYIYIYKYVAALWPLFNMF